MSDAVRDLVEEYVTAVGEKRLDRVAEMVLPDATFTGTVAHEASGREAFVQGFRNLVPILDRTEIRRIVVDGDHAAVLYDFVTSTPGRRRPVRGVPHRRGRPDPLERPALRLASLARGRRRDQVPRSDRLTSIGRLSRVPHSAAKLCLGTTAPE